MLIDSIKLAEGSTVTNLTVAMGTSFPLDPNDGEFFLKDESGVNNLYIYHTGAWNRVADEQTIQSTLGYTPVNKAGDTMTGPLVLSANPTASMHAVTKTYVDTAIAGVGGGGGRSSTFTVTGDVTGTLDGGTDVLTLANSGVTAGTYAKISVNAKGLVTFGDSLNSSDITTALGYTPVNSSVLGSANGVATLDSNGLLNISQIPSITISDTFVVNSQAAMLGLSTAEVGDIAVRTDINKSFILKDAGFSTLANWQELLTPTDTVTSVNGQTGAVTISSITGNAGTATALQTARTISLTGDATASGSFDGTSNLALTTTLANTSVTLGSYGSATQVGTFTVDAKGRLTAAGNTTITPAWTSITGKPTTISGYGITDALNKNGDTLNGTLAVTTGNKITIADAPVNGVDAANKNYVDSAIAGLSWKQAVRVAAVSNIVLSGTQTIDGVAVVANDRVLVMGQTAASQNGLYVVSAGAWTRSSDADTMAEIAGMAVWVTEGTTYSDTGWTCTNNASDTLNSTSIAFVQFNGAAGITAGTGLTKSGNTLNVALGAGIGSLPTNEVGIDLYPTSSGLILTTDGSTSSTATGAQLALSNTGVGAGTYKSVTVDVKGRITAGSNPTTLSGYGITDAQSLNANLTSIAGLSTAATGLVKLTNGVASLDTSAYLTTITSSQVTTALGYTPYNSTNPNGYTSNTGTVTTVSVSSANGFAGSVATAGTTPAITISTSVNGILKGNGTSVTAAVAGDFPTLNQNTTGTAAVATAITIANDTTTATSVYPLWSASLSGNTNSKISGNLSYVPSTGTLTATAFVGALTGNASTATTSTNVTVATDNASSTSFYPMFSATLSGAASPKISGNLSYVPSTGTLTATTFSGALNGNASTATTATNATVVADTTTAVSVYPIWSANTSGSNAHKVSGGLSYVPSTGTLTASTFSGALAGNASSASAVAITADAATATSVYPVWTSSTSGNGSARVTNTKLSFVPSTGVLTATSFSGSGAGLTSIPNAALTNSSVTVGSTAISLGSSATTLAGLTSVTSTTFVGSLTGTASTATNLAGGSLGTIPYQSAAGTTAMLAVGTAGQVLTCNGAAAPTWTTPSGGAASTLTGTTLASNVVTSSLTSVGTLTGLTINNTITTPSVTLSNPGINLVLQPGATTNAQGANVVLSGGQSGSGAVGAGHVVLNGGNTVAAGQNAGQVQINGGIGSLGSGSVVITGGTTTSTSNTQGAVTIVGGTQAVASATAAAGPVTIQGGPTSIAATTAGAVNIQGGNGSNATSNGGTVTIDGGTAGASGVGGAILFRTGPTTAVSERFRITNTGALAIAGSTNYGTSGQVLTSAGNASPSWSSTLTGLTASALTTTGVKTTVVDKGTVSTGTVTFDFTAGNVQRLQVGGALSITASNWPSSGTRGYLLLKIVNGGSATVTVTPTINWIKPDGTTTTSMATYMTSIGRTGLQTSGTDQIVWWTDDAGTTIYGKAV